MTNPLTKEELEELRDALARYDEPYDSIGGGGWPMAPIIAGARAYLRYRLAQAGLMESAGLPAASPPAPAVAQDGREAQRRFEIRRLLVELLCEHCDELMDNQADRIMHKVVHPLLAENARLKAYVEDWGSRLELSARCCRDAQALTARAEADANRLAEALRPFAKIADCLTKAAYGPAWGFNGGVIEHDDFRNARSALAEHDKGVSQ